MTSAPFNDSISKSILALGGVIETPENVALSPDTEDVVMDVSDYRFFDPIARGKRISEIYDHHVGFEEHWKNELGNRAKIEFIGCAATLVFEEWERADLAMQMSPETAKVLIAAMQKEGNQISSAWFRTPYLGGGLFAHELIAC